eukprot:13004802-Heterocapsa_arctica.AAC.1
MDWTAPIITWEQAASALGDDPSVNQPVFRGVFLVDTFLEATSAEQLFRNAGAGDKFEVTVVYLTSPSSLSESESLALFRAPLMAMYNLRKVYSPVIVMVLYRITAEKKYVTQDTWDKKLKSPAASIKAWMASHAEEATAAFAQLYPIRMHGTSSGE